MFEMGKIEIGGNIVMMNTKELMLERIVCRTVVGSKLEKVKEQAVILAVSECVNVSFKFNEVEYLVDYSKVITSIVMVDDGGCP